MSHEQIGNAPANLAAGDGVGWPAMDESSLVVLTQNAWGGAPLWAQRRERLARAIADLGPDVVGLQEIHAPTPSGDGSQAHELAELAGGYDAWFAPGRVTASGHAEGVALLVKRSSLVALDRSVLALSLDAADPLEGPHQRVVLRAAVRRGDTVVDVLCTHLSLSRRARERTLGELGAFAARERERSGSEGAVLVGDFNAPPQEPALRHPGRRRLDRRLAPPEPGRPRRDLAGGRPLPPHRLRLGAARRGLDRGRVPAHAGVGIGSRGDCRRRAPACGWLVRRRYGVCFSHSSCVFPSARQTSRRGCLVSSLRYLEIALADCAESIHPSGRTGVLDSRTNSM